MKDLTGVTYAKQPAPLGPNPSAFKDQASKTKRISRYGWRRLFPYFGKALDKRLCRCRVVIGTQRSHLIEVKTVHEAAIIHDHKRIVNRLRRGASLMDAYRMSVDTQ